MARLGELLGRYRMKKNLSKQGISNILKKGIASWLSVESGRAQPRLGTLIRIGKELGFELELHAYDGSYVLSLEDDIVVADDRPMRIKSRRLDRILESLTPEQMDYVCKIASVTAEQAQKKKTSKPKAG